MLNPTEHQLKSIEFIINSITTGKKIIGFIAPGGCGKTFSLKHVANDPRLSDTDITFTATTNKAASVMKKEGLKGSKTLHSAISTHIPTQMFKELTLIYELNSVGKSPEITDLVKEFLIGINVKESKLFDYKNEKILLAENKIDSFDDRVFSHYTTSDYKGGVVFIDEASMLPSKCQYNNERKMKAIGLDAVQKVFDTVVLVGDDSQLPPINGSSSFEGIEKTTLTKNMRAEDGLLRLLDCARKGDNLSNFSPKEGENVTVVASLSKGYYDMKSLIENDVVHIVYKNKTRKLITKMIRGDLSCEPTENEPIVYKGANIDEPDDCISRNEVGKFNGVIGEWDNHKQSVSGRNFDEYGEGFTYLQYGYAITAHCAQGSSYDHVIVHLDDIPHFIDKETKRQWVYTAVSRARKGVVIVF